MSDDRPYLTGYKAIPYDQESQPPHPDHQQQQQQPMHDPPLPDPPMPEPPSTQGYDQPPQDSTPQPGENPPIGNGRRRKSGAGTTPVDDRYYDGKWWRQGSYAKLKSLEGANGVGDDGMRQQSINEERGGPVAFNLGGNADDNTTEMTNLLRPNRESAIPEEEIKTPAEKVRFMLSPKEKKDEGEKEEELLDMEMHGLFCQMDVLCHFDDGVMGWKEAARWLKYEEKVEMGDRWSKPHVPTTSLHSLFELRRCVAEDTCSVILDMDASHGCLHQVAEMIVSLIKEEMDLSEEECRNIVDVLLKPHKHKHRKGQKNANPDTSTHNNNHNHSKQNGKEGTPKSKFKIGAKKNENETSALQYTYPNGMTPDELRPHKPNKKLMRKIPGGSEAANILVGTVDFLREPVMAFVRLKDSACLADLTEVAVPTRFLFVVLGPRDTTAIWEYEEVGRAMASLCTDRVFCEVAYKATSRQDILDGIDEYIDDLTVLPPSIWDPSTRLEPPEQTVSMEKIRRRLLQSSRHAAGEDAFHFAESAGTDATLTRTGRLFGGLWKDIKRRYPQYWSDIRDGFHIQCFASIIFLYFACVTPIVTFGGLLGQATDNYMGTMETMLAGAMCGLLWHTFSGQPLTIVGATGPMLIFEGILYLVCRDFGIPFLTFRFYVGAWVFLYLILMVAFDLSALVAYITRFTEESFAVLISLIFIFEAFKKLFSIMFTHPIDTHTGPEHIDFRCHCDHPLYNNITTEELQELAPVTNSSVEHLVNINDWDVHGDCITYQHRVIVDTNCISEMDCTSGNWTLTGDACGVYASTHSVPDVFFLSAFLFIGTFCIAYFFRTFRNSNYFPSIVRSTLSDFAVLIAILCCTSLDFWMGLDTPKLQVPDRITPTRSDRGWLVNPLDFGKWWVPLIAFLPALLATILIFLDQQITAVIVNRKEHKLKKGHGYHLDLFVLSFTILLCSLLGMPWFVAATVRAITHVRSLIMESELRAPGERPQFLGVREQRFTGICIHLLISASVFLTGILQHIPMAVLYGVFLYMGITSLAGVQFVDRILILLMPTKYQPDHIYLRHVQSNRVHIFTLVQITCMVIMWIVKSTKSIAILFPVMLIILCIIRKCFDFVFSQRELYWLDHLLPDETRKKREDENKRVEKELSEAERMPLEGDWDKLTAKRDYGYGKKQRHRKLSEGVINRYNREHAASREDIGQKHAHMDEDEHISNDLGAPIRERKFSIQKKGHPQV